MQVNRQCLVCGKSFTAYQTKVDEGKALYCSKSCAGKAKHGNKSVEQRFWEKVDKSNPNGCWTWTGSTQTTFGYGSFNRGSVDGKSRTDVAHRVSYELAYGLIPEGLFVCHRCDNPRCVHPNHLFLGTHTDNMIDMHQKGRSIEHTRPERHARGERQHLAKLTASQVQEIRHRHENNKDDSLTRLCKEFRISRSTLCSILRRDTWKHV